MTDAEIYEAAITELTEAQADLARARHLLELAERRMAEAEMGLDQLEAHPGIPHYLHACPCPALLS